MAIHFKCSEMPEGDSCSKVKYTIRLAEVIFFYGTPLNELFEMYFESDLNSV
jgi:hypothetical protein